MLLTYLQLVYGGQVIRIQNSEASDEKYIVFDYDEKTGLKYVIVLDELGKELFNSKENADRCGLEDITNDGNFGVYLVFLDRKLYCLFDATGRAYFPESRHNEPARYAEEIYQLNETNNTFTYEKIFFLYLIYSIIYKHITPAPSKYYYKQTYRAYVYHCNYRTSI